jgi:hypothetical protein
VADTNIRRDICTAMATAFTAAVPGLPCQPQPLDEEDQSAYPALVIIPLQMQFDECNDIVRDDTVVDKALVEVGAFVGRCELRLYARTPSERELWEQPVLNAFHQQELATGTMVLQGPSGITVNGTTFGFKSQGALMLDTVEWRDEMVFDAKRYSYIECDFVFGVYATRNAYNMDHLVIALNNDLGSDVADEEWSVAEDGTRLDDAYYLSVASDNPSLHWRGDDPFGLTLRDYSGNGNTGHINGTPSGGSISFQQPGIVKGTQYCIQGVTIPYQFSTNIAKLAIVDPKHFSVEFWLQPSALGNDYNDVSLVDQAGGDLLFRTHASGDMDVVLNGVTLTTASSALVAGQISHWVFTCNVGTWILYLNGASVAAGFVSTVFTQADDLTFQCGTIDFYGVYLAGAFSEMAVYPTDLKPDRVLDHYNLGRL